MFCRVSAQMLQTMILLSTIESGTNVHLIIDAGTRIWINTYIWKYIVYRVYKGSFFFLFFFFFSFGEKKEE